MESTPRRSEPAQLSLQEEERGERAASPLPPPAIYEDRRRLRQARDDAPPARPVSPLPPAAVYVERPKRREIVESSRSPERVPEAAVYVERSRVAAADESAPVVGRSAQPSAPANASKQREIPSGSSSESDESSSEEEAEEEKEESRFQAESAEYPRFRVLNTRFEDVVKEDAEAGAQRYQSKRSDDISESEEERDPRIQEASKRADEGRRE